MADTTVDSTGVNTLLDVRGVGVAGPYWISPSTGMIIYIDSNTDLIFAKTTDSGNTWSETVIDNGFCLIYAIWFDQETPGDTGNLIHIAWYDFDATSIFYINIDISNETIGTRRTVASSLSGVSAVPWTHRIAITKSKGGNIVLAYGHGTTIDCLKSSDLFATAGTSIRNVFETGTEEDYVLLFPADTADDNDVCAIFHDRSSTELSIKMYDDSVDSWSETSIATSQSFEERYWVFDGAVRHSDGNIFLVAHSDGDSTGDDLLTWDLAVDSIASPTVTAKTNIFTNQGESSQAAVLINQQNDDVYVSYIKGGTWLGEGCAVVFHKTTDGGTNWDSESSYSETSDDNRNVHGGRTIGDNGGRVQWCWYNDDIVAIYVNEVNDIEVAAASAAGTNIQINIGDSWKVVDGMQINIGDAWKTVVSVQQNIGDTWKTVY